VPDHDDAVEILRDLRRAITGSVVNDDDLEPLDPGPRERIVLRQHAPDDRGDRHFFVERRDDHR